MDGFLVGEWLLVKRDFFIGSLPFNGNETETAPWRIQFERGTVPLWVELSVCQIQEWVRCFLKQCFFVVAPQNNRGGSAKSVI